jgi:molecular chaperone DnaK
MKQFIFFSIIFCIFYHLIYVIFIQTAKKSLEDLETHLSSEDKDKVNNACKALEEAVKTEDTKMIESKTKSLEEILTPIMQSAAAQEKNPDNEQKATDNVNQEKKNNDDIVDADFEEVKNNSEK